MRNTRVRILKSPITFVCVIVSICCFLILIMTIFKLPEISITDSIAHFKPIKTNFLDNSIGKFGNMILEMLPKDLAFTVFLPSERAFYRDLGLNASKSLEGENFHDTYAILTRILGFSVVPRKIMSGSLASDEEIVFDSISGYGIYVSKDLDGRVVANRIWSERVDLRMGEVVVHIIDGVVMDSEFEESVRPDDDLLK